MYNRGVFKKKFGLLLSPFPWAATLFLVLFLNIDGVSADLFIRLLVFLAFLPLLASEIFLQSSSTSTLSKSTVLRFRRLEISL